MNFNKWTNWTNYNLDRRRLQIFLSELKVSVLWHMLEDVSESIISNYIWGFHYTFKRDANIVNAANAQGYGLISWCIVNGTVNKKYLEKHLYI